MPLLQIQIHQMTTASMVCYHLLDLPELAPVSSESVPTSQSVAESLQLVAEGPSARGAVKSPVRTFCPLEGFEFLSAEQPMSLGVGQPVAVRAEQSMSLGVGQSVAVSAEQSVSVGVVQTTAEVAPSTGTIDIVRDAGPTPGAGAVPGIPVEHQGFQEPPEQSSAADHELLASSSDIIAPSGNGETDSLTCGQRLPSTRSSSPINSSFEVIPDSDDNNNDVCRGTSSTPPVQLPKPPSAFVGGGAVGLPPLEMAGLLAIIREDHLQDFGAVATHLLQRYRSDLDQPTLTRLLQAMSATRPDGHCRSDLRRSGISDRMRHFGCRNRSRAPSLRWKYPPTSTLVGAYRPALTAVPRWGEVRFSASLNRRGGKT